MIQFLVKRFIKDYQNVNNPEVRQAYGILSGMLGIIGNFILFTIKLIIGILSNSIAIISDAFNNFSDSTTSVVTIIGSKYSNKPADKEHPYGHGRIEYIASLVVAFIILLVAIQLLINSIDKIFNPQPVEINFIAMGLLLVSILIKLWMFFYNRYIGNQIQSSLVLATAKDSLNDVLVTSGVIIGTILGMHFTFPFDGLLGLLISFFILYTGYTIGRDAIHVLLGTSPDPDVFEKIQEIVSESTHVDYCHDLKIHDYGPGRKIASMHVVVPADLSVKDAHDMIHELEGKIKTILGIEIVIHMDPSDDIDIKTISKKSISRTT